MSAVRILVGDCRERLKELPDNSVDSVVCDPPYHLLSTVKRFGKVPRTESTMPKSEPHARMSRGFMGQTWDGGAVAFEPETWVEVIRVLKPGGHLVAFSGTRTYHRMVCAIEDAGFEVRDMIAWHYGSGFPKSHDISKAIDRRGGADIGWFGPWLREERERRGIKQKELAKHFPSATGGLTGCIANWELGLNTPTVEQFNTLCDVLELPFTRLEEAEREVVGRNKRKAGWFTGNDGHDITAAASDPAKQWEGWGTALKPATEPICLARKPLSEKSIAANVLKWGTGAINIDGCRIHGADDPVEREGEGSQDQRYSDEGATNFAATPGRRYKVKRFKPGATLNAEGGKWKQDADGPDYEGELKPGRWPANIVHDGSDEVVEAFPDAPGQLYTVTGNEPSSPFANIYGDMPNRAGSAEPRGDSGSAARFFYTAKATTAERGEGNNHPTVKPVALMRWLCRLVTPKGGTVLDPFMGSGSTGLACDAEQFDFIGCELSAEYAAIAERRIKDAAGMFADVKVAA